MLDPPLTSDRSTQSLDIVIIIGIVVSLVVVILFVVIAVFCAMSGQCRKNVPTRRNSQAEETMDNGEYEHVSDPTSPSQSTTIGDSSIPLDNVPTQDDVIFTHYDDVGYAAVNKPHKAKCDDVITYLSVNKHRNPSADMDEMDRREKETMGTVYERSISVLNAGVHK